MKTDRRHFLAQTTLGAAFTASAMQADEADDTSLHLAQRIRALFTGLPDRIALKIWAPRTEHESEFLLEINSGQQMFVASTMKSIILCERLRQLDSGDVGARIKDHQLALNRDVWSPGSDIFNPPNLSGLVSERTTMEAMVIHSDNTATDMVLKQAGPDLVRSFIASIGLTQSLIPDSTRVFAGYIFGAPNYKTITWDQLDQLRTDKLTHPFLNDVQTLASSPDDLVSFFSRALQGKFFDYPQTLFQFRRILALGDITYLVPFPIGLSVFGKAGYSDFPGSHARSIAGGVYFPHRWVYFSFVLNWDASEPQDPETESAFYSGIHKSIALLQERLRT